MGHGHPLEELGLAKAADELAREWVSENVDMTVGNLHLTDQEENQIVKFLETLSDGFTRPYPDIDTFTGMCMTGGDASTQGNALIVPAVQRQQQL